MAHRWELCRFFGKESESCADFREDYDFAIIVIQKIYKQKMGLKKTSLSNIMKKEMQFIFKI